MRVATWNVNSLPVRLTQVLAWIKANDIDVLLVQETKVIDDKFPRQAIEEAGYQVVFAGQKTYNGVAILSKQSLENVQVGIGSWPDEQVRVISATVAQCRFVNVYIPNGQQVGSEKFAYKLEWLSQLTQWLHDELAQYSDLLLMGDFNIAPRDQDVHDPEVWQGSVLVSPEEREAMAGICALGLHDSFAEKPDGDTLFSWWDYRQAAFRRNRGLRIDHICVTASVLARSERCYIDPEPRGWERPSDHTPVVLEFIDKKS